MNLLTNLSTSLRTASPSTSPRSASASSSPPPTRKVSFKDDFYPPKDNSEEPKRLVEKSRSKSSPQLLVHIPINKNNDWQTNKSISSGSISQNEPAPPKNTGKENFRFRMPSELLSSLSYSENSTQSVINSPDSGISNNSNSRSTSPQLGNSSSSSILISEPSESQLLPQSREFSVYLPRLSSKNSSSNSTDSPSSSPSTGKKSSRIQRAFASIHDTIIIQKKDRSLPSSSSSTTSPRENAKDNLLRKISNDDLKNLAKKITLLKNSHQFNNFSAKNQDILIQAECMKYLPPESEFQDAKKIDILINGLQPYLNFEESLVDKTIDLADPQFLDFVNSAAEAAFIKTWDKDSSDVEADLKKYLDAVKPTFARDFQHSDYFMQDSDGSTKKLESIDEFLDFFKEDNSPSTLLISNIASQNLGNFFQNALFLRHDENQQSQSVLQSSEGIPLLPLAISKASYTFKKNEDGSVDIFYERKSSQEINGSKEMRAKKMTEEFHTFSVRNASLTIQAKIHVNQDGTWNIFNPHVHAQGWIE